MPVAKQVKAVLTLRQVCSPPTAIDSDSLARVLKGNQKFQELLASKLGTQYFGNINLEVVVHDGKVVQVNVSGIEKIR